MARPKPPFPNGANGFHLIVCRRDDQLALDRSISIHLGNSPTIYTDSQSVLEGDLRIALKRTRSRGKRQSQPQQPAVLLRTYEVPPTRISIVNALTVEVHSEVLQSDRRSMCVLEPSAPSCNKGPQTLETTDTEYESAQDSMPHNQGIIGGSSAPLTALTTDPKRRLSWLNISFFLSVRANQPPRRKPQPNHNF